MKTLIDDRFKDGAVLVALEEDGTIAVVIEFNAPRWLQFVEEKVIGNRALYTGQGTAVSIASTDAGRIALTVTFSANDIIKAFAKTTS